jgi:hypothetical protein
MKSWFIKGQILVFFLLIMRPGFVVMRSAPLPWPSGLAGKFTMKPGTGPGNL